MTELLDNPVIKDEVSDDAFLEAAALADQGRDIPAELISAKPADTRAAEPETPAEETGAPDNSEAETEKKTERPRDELGRFTKTEAGEDIPESERKPAEQKPEAKPETAYTKAQKERVRLDQSWKELNARKSEIQAQKDQLAREVAELQQARQQRQAPNPAQSQGTRYTSGELVEAAGVFEANAEKAFEAGDADAFKENLNLARNARQQAGEVYQLEQQAHQQAQAHQFQTEYSRVTDKTMEAEPDLKNPESALSKDVLVLLQSEAVFSHIPDGFAKAVQVAKWKMEAGSASELRDNNKKLQAEIDRLNGLTQLNGSGPTSPPAQKSFESMTPQEQDAYFVRQAEKADQGNY